MIKAIASVGVIAALIVGCSPETASTSGNSATLSTDGLTPAEACSSRKTRDGLVRVLAEHVPGDVRDKRDALAEFRPLVAFDMTTVDAVDAQTGAITCSANLRMRAGNVAPYVPTPSGISARQDGRDIVVRVTYQLSALADAPGSMLTLTDDAALSELMFSVQALRERSSEVLEDSATNPQQYGDKESPAVAPDDEAGPDGGSNQSE